MSSAKENFYGTWKIVCTYYLKKRKPFCFAFYYTGCFKTQGFIDKNVKW